MNEYTIQYKLASTDTKYLKNLKFQDILSCIPQNFKK